MEPMTVFGFGHRPGSVDNLLSTAPLQITVRRVETTDPDLIRKTAAEE